MTAKIKHFIGRVPYATHTTHRIPAPRFDQTSGPGNTDLNPTDDERRILDAARAAAVALKMTFDNWVTMGRALQLLRKKADLLGAPMRSTICATRTGSAIGSSTRPWSPSCSG